MTLHGMDGYVHDLATGQALFGRIVVDREDDMVRLFDRANGELVAKATLKQVGSFGLLSDMMGVQRYHVGDAVRRECLRESGAMRMLQKKIEAAESAQEKTT